MPQSFTILFGKAVRSAMRLRGGGSALPGLVMERVDPGFVPRTLEQLPMGVVVISGTNGKTTTTKMVAELLTALGYKVFTNRSGSNFVRGVAAALLGEIDRKGKLNADIAVLELDEAHAVKFTKVVKPRHSLFLNVMRDQLDRFGEIDTTARMLAHVARATTESVVLNREDARIAAIAKILPSEVTVSYFGLSPTLREQFPSDDEMHSMQQRLTDGPHQTTCKDQNTSRVSAPVPASPILTKQSSILADVVLEEFTGLGATYQIAAKRYTSPLVIKGIYNIYNSAGALALVRSIIPGAPLGTLFTALSKITPAFGRGEVVTIGGQPLELVLVKNPAGFRLGLESYEHQGYATLIAINDEYADGRDMSWLWDVDFTPLAAQGEPTPAISVTGIRAYDMALRLQYDDVAVLRVHTDLAASLREFIEAFPSQPKRIYCTYTAMLALRKELSRITKVESIS